MNKIIEFFKKIKNCFIQIFNPKSIKLIEANTSNDKQKILTLDDVNKEEQEREEFFTLYKNVKNGTIKITDLMINDLIKVQSMMQKESDVLDEKIGKMEDELLKLDTEIAVLKKIKKFMKRWLIIS